MRHMRKVEVELHAFLMSALDGGGWSASHPSCFTLGDKASVPFGKEAGWAAEPDWLWQ